MFLVEQLRKSIAAGSKRAFQIAFRDAAPVEQQISDAAAIVDSDSDNVAVRGLSQT